MSLQQKGPYFLTLRLSIQVALATCVMSDIKSKILTAEISQQISVSYLQLYRISLFPFMH